MAGNRSATKLDGPTARGIRRNKQLKLRFVAGQVGISAPYLSRLERGLKGTRGIDPAVVQRLADVLSVPVDAIAATNEAANEAAA